MARKRMLSPEMFTSRTVAALKPEVRWTWAGMLCYLDDYGYGDDSPQLVKAAVWAWDDPMTSRKVSTHLDLIVEGGSLCRFECCDRPQIHAPAWKEWQTVQHPGKPRFCPCPTHDTEGHESHVRSSRGSTETLTPNVVKGSSSQISASAADAPTLAGSRILDAYVRRHGPLPRQVRQKLGAQIDQLFHDGISEPHICAALDAWAGRPDAGPGLLPHLVKTTPADGDPSKAYLRETS